ncbi:nicotinate phosphoribosyltransferase [Peptostreptococcus porci]|uniref:nicotinate phosphoribosyltransferase n=1 Tax=Peptostreptococcus porci TaxID=2652282 RepID=UPI002A91E963|nr:nicotinate phosphoribosyltransferase [Peptostreptococcus porci]MDY6232305.1 nicotinate phosphoribosyltransferase [Peptostreptococcus porci]
MKSKTNPMLLIDFYKAVHAEMLPKNITKSVSYFTPRMSRVKRWGKVVMFGLQGFIKTYLIDYFNEEFFDKPFEEIIYEYKRIMDASLGKDTYKIDKIENLHKLGYLPIEIVALPEGTMVPMHVPMFGITNTHKDFAWLPQALESLVSAEMWHPMLAATVGKTYRDIVNYYYDLTCDDSIPKSKALGAFDFRGEECLESAVKAGAGWCLSFLNTATVPTIPYLEKNYFCDCTKEDVAYGSPSTEHSVMCSNYAIDGDEITLLRRLLTEIYPNTSFSAVLDSYDYWNVINNILPQLKTEIMNHNGCMLMRGDSGDCVEVVTKTVFKLWDEFGGTINSKGYKVLDPHVKAIYGDSITVQRCEEIYKILMENGFSCSNVALGVGSFSFQCIEEDGFLKPFTRDTFSSCIKATYCEIDDKPFPIFKNPKDGGFKKSQKGCCRVYTRCDGSIYYEDELTWEQATDYEKRGNMLIPVFKDGELLKEQSLKEIRDRLHGGEF